MTTKTISILYFIIHRKRRSKNTGRRRGKIKKGKLKNWEMMMQDPPMKWPQSWDSLVSARKRSDKFFPSKQFTIIEKENVG